MRIAMLSYYLPSTSKMGIGYQAHELATELVRRGHEVDVFSDCPPVEGATYGHRHVAMTGRLRTFRFALALRRIDYSGYDVVHAQGDDQWLLGRRVPHHVRTINGSCFEEARRIRGLKEKLRMVMLGLSETLATFVADDVAMISPQTGRWMPWVRRVIPCGTDTTLFRPDPTRRSQRPVVLFVGAWFGRKRGRELADAFAEHVLPHLPDAELHMVSRDVPPDAPPFVRVLGALTPDELVAAYQTAWVFCLPSSYEGFGIPFVEAMACGTPVVATPNPGSRYVTDEGRAAVMVPMERVGEELAALLRDPARRAALTEVGLRRSVEFSLTRVTDLYLGLYARGGTPARTTEHAHG